MKDKLENKLHRMVCDGGITLAEAQQAIATDWIAAYKRFVGPEPSQGGKPSDQLCLSMHSV